MSKDEERQEMDRLNQLYDGRDDFLGKDLLTIANKNSSSRNIMFHRHVEQFVNMTEPDFPRVFTSYENQVGRHSNFYKQVDNESTVIAKISKFESSPELLYHLIVKDIDGNYDIIDRKEAEFLSEVYGFKYNNDNIDNKSVGDKLVVDEVLTKSPSFDEHMNYRYGKNAKTLFMIHQPTIEDAVVITQEFADTMKYHHVEEVEISLNGNDFMLNLYGDDDNYQVLPEPGQDTNGSILCAVRRIIKEHRMTQMHISNSKDINFDSDTLIYVKGTVVDFNVFTNIPLMDIPELKYNHQLRSAIINEKRYYGELYQALEPLMETPDKCSDDVKFLFNKAKARLDDKKKFYEDDEPLNHIIIKLKVLSEQSVTVGSKITNRHGSKGVISKIVPASEMPVNQYGERPDIIQNALSIVNRLNPAALFEIELNFLADNVVRRYKTDPEYAFEDVLRFVKDVDYQYGENVRIHYESLSDDQKTVTKQLGFI